MTATEDDHKRLGDFYSDLSDGELGNIAEDSTSLTEAAREELTRELKNRGRQSATNEDRNGQRKRTS
jgi:hypothetical protein